MTFERPLHEIKRIEISDEEEREEREERERAAPPCGENLPLRIKQERS